MTGLNTFEIKKSEQRKQTLQKKKIFKRALYSIIQHTR
jgi:hypothetical protein